MFGPHKHSQICSSLPSFTGTIHLCWWQVNCCFIMRISIIVHLALKYMNNSRRFICNWTFWAKTEAFWTYSANSKGDLAFQQLAFQQL